MPTKTSSIIDLTENEKAIQKIKRDFEQDMLSRTDPRHKALRGGRPNLVALGGSSLNTLGALIVFIGRFVMCLGKRHESEKLTGRSGRTDSTIL